MNTAPKHSPFQSIYRQDFEVLEEKQGKLRLYPHTQQLPLLLRALNLEFYGALPDNIARTDKRGDGFHKVMLKTAALHFCGAVNSRRTDQLRLYALPNPDLVHKVAIVQQITEDTKRGPVHRFRFYAGADFFPEIRLSGRTVAFADHVLQRFSARVPNNVGEDLTVLLLAFFGTPHIALPVGPGYAFVVAHMDSILAFPFKLSDTEFLITTCLTINEMNSLREEFPPLTFNLHYGGSFAVPRLRHWSPTKWMSVLYARWEKKVPLPPPPDFARDDMAWHRAALRVKDRMVKEGHGPGSGICFLDHVPGPGCTEIRPGETEPRVNELEFYKQQAPESDWDAIFARREKAITEKVEG